MAESEGNFKILLLAYNLILKLSLMCCLGFSLYSLTPLQIQHSWVAWKALALQQLLPYWQPEVTSTVSCFSHLTRHYQSLKFKLFKSLIAVNKHGLLFSFPSFCEHFSTNPCWHLKGWVVSTGILRHFQHRTKRARVP